MSEQLNDADAGYGPVAQPTVDVLPAPPARRSREQEPQPTAAEGPWPQPAPVDDAPLPAAAWAGPPAAVHDLPPVFPPPVDAADQAPAWFGPADFEAQGWPALPEPASNAAPAPTEALSTPVPPPAQPVAPAAQFTAQPLDAPIPPPWQDESAGLMPASDVPAKRFLGMQLRRPRRDTEADEAGRMLAGPPAPIAAWPTDVGMSVVADAEPAHAQWAAPAQPLPGIPPVQAATWTPPAPPAPQPWQPTSVADVVAELPVMQAGQPAPPETTDPVDGRAPAAVADPDAAVTAMPVVPQPAPTGELGDLRGQVQAEAARRSAAEQRADHAVAYAQQLQAELSRVTADLEGRLQAAEVRIRACANEAQDWQIRHREAQAQVAELAVSVQGAEQRLSELRDERDELRSALDTATSPTRAAVAEQLAES